MERVLRMEIDPGVAERDPLTAPGPLWDEEAWATMRAHHSMGMEIREAVPPRLRMFNDDLQYAADTFGVWGDETTGVYVIHATGTDWVKVGLTGNLRGRLQTLQTGCPHALVVHQFICGPASMRPGLSALEDAAHAVFDAWGAPRRPGSEWFQIDPHLASEALCWSLPPREVR